VSTAIKEEYELLELQTRRSIPHMMNKEMKDKLGLTLTTANSQAEKNICGLINFTYTYLSLCANERTLNIRNEA